MASADKVTVGKIEFLLFAEFSVYACLSETAELLAKSYILSSYCCLVVIVPLLFGLLFVAKDVLKELLNDRLKFDLILPPLPGPFGTSLERPFNKFKSRISAADYSID